MAQMSFFSLLILCLIFDSFVESKAMNSQYRRRRESPPIPKKAILFAQLARDVNDTTNHIQVWLNKTEESVKKITKSIAEGLVMIGKAGMKNETVIEQWKSMKSELRNGINLIIDAYEKYLALHKKLLEDINTYVQGLIKKYKAEGLAVERMVPPSLSDPTQLVSDDLQKILNSYFLYAHQYGYTLSYGFDAAKDSFQNAIKYHTDLFYPSDPPMQYIPPSVYFGNAGQYETDPTGIYCDAIDQNNGNRGCADSVAEASFRQAHLSCYCLPND